MERYRSNPNDPALRQAAVEKGRLYSLYTTNGYGIASFNETSIRNDLDAIPTPATAPSKVEPPKTTIESRLLTLEGLLNQGLITEVEYQTRRSAILDEV